MPVQQNVNAFLGAAVLGVIGAAGMFLVEYYRQEKMRNAMAKDLARLDQELVKLRSELQQLQSRSSERSNHIRRSNKSKVKKANSILSTSTDDYLSASNMDSSDMEFYDVSDDELDNSITINLDAVLTEIDRILDLGSVEEAEDILKRLEDLCIEYPENPELLFRIARAHHKILDSSDDKEFIKERIAKGLEATTTGLKVAPNHSEIHKWHAILVGSRTDFVSLQEKISDGHLFKKHVDIALSLSPNDASLHHMLGRFDYEVAGLKWYERKVAAAIYGEPPTSTFEEAYSHFLKAENLANFDWRDNRLMLGKCKIALGDYDEAVEWLEKANSCKHGEDLDDKVNREINKLLQKYGNKR